MTASATIFATNAFRLLLSPIRKAVFEDLNVSQAKAFASP
jgi:hypothetical protein